MALSVLFSVLAVPVSAVESPAPVVASPTPVVNSKPVVIIDSYFDTRIANTTIVCIATDKCVNTPKPSKRVSDPVNHGMAMAEVARRNNPDVPLILVRSATVSNKGAIGILNGNDFLAALKWVDTNSSTISAVSFSYGLSGNMTKPG
jgi:L-aminopeptidase/D-esterase-like protein